MKTILEILERAGGYSSTLHLHIDNPPYVPLVIEALPMPGPLGLLAISVAHYSDLNGDLMCDPEMLFELGQPVGGDLILDPFYWRNDYVGVEHRSRFIREGSYFYLPDIYVEHQHFASEWDKNLTEQGFFRAFCGNHRSL